jgi:hypothetical protein
VWWWRATARRVEAVRTAEGMEQKKNQKEAGTNRDETATRPGRQQARGTDLKEAGGGRGGGRGMWTNPSGGSKR